MGSGFAIRVPCAGSDFEGVLLEEHRVLVVAIYGSEAHGAVEAIRGLHGLRHGVEVHGGVTALARNFDDCFGEFAAEASSLLRRAHPEALHLAGMLVGTRGLRQLERLEGHASGRISSSNARSTAPAGSA